jgi:pyruvate formate-lyase activating enzyme-like uncharacterized protein
MKPEEECANVKWKAVGKEKQNSVGRKRDGRGKTEHSGREPVGAGSVSVAEKSSQMRRDLQNRYCPARLSDFKILNNTIKKLLQVVAKLFSCETKRARRFKILSHYTSTVTNLNKLL